MLFARRKTVKIITTELSAIHEFSSHGHGAEVGGLLLGHWQDSDVIIDRIVEVADPSATYSSWSREEKRAQAVLENSLKADNQKLRGYVGDWHTHPEMIGASLTDISSLKKASRQYDEPIVLVVGLPGGALDIHAAINGKLCKVDVIS